MAAKPAVLLYKGRPLSFRHTPRPVAIIKAQLDSSPAGEVFTKDQLKAVHASDYATAPELDGYSCKVGSTRYWGNPAAIKALRERLENEG